MPIHVQLGLDSVIVSEKIDPGRDASPENLRIVPRPDVGRQTLTVSVPETHVVEHVVNASDLNDTAYRMPGHVLIPTGKTGTNVKAENAHALDPVHHVGGASVLRQLDGDAEVVLRTTVWPLEQQIAFVREAVALNSATGRAAWVTSDDPLVQAALASHFGCLEGRPSDWKNGS
jgi:hypothetical protein